MQTTNHSRPLPSSIDDDWPSEYLPDEVELISTRPATTQTHVMGTINIQASTRSSPVHDADSSQFLGDRRAVKKESDKHYIKGLDIAPGSPLHETQSSLTQAQWSCVPIPFANKPGHFPGLMQRSSLFSVGRTSRGADSLGSTPKSQGSYNLAVTGPRLSMHDKALWEALVDIAKERNHDLTQPLRTSLSDIARRCGATFTGSRTTTAAREGLERLVKTQITCQIGQAGTVTGRLLGDCQFTPHGTIAMFDTDFAATLLGSDLNFQVNLATRRELDSSLAQWMHDFMSTHSETRSLTFKHLRELCGFGAQAKRFPASLLAAMDELKTKAPGIVAGYSVTKTTKDSDWWELRITRGSDLPKFVGYKPKASDSPARVGPRRGGVAL